MSITADLRLTEASIETSVAGLGGGGVKYSSLETRKVVQ